MRHRMGLRLVVEVGRMGLVGLDVNSEQSSDH
jgi:hypothetical protein